MPKITIFPLRDPEGWRLRASADNEYLDHAARALSLDESLVLHDPNDGQGLASSVAQLKSKMIHAYPGVPVEVAKECTCAAEVADQGGWNHAKWCLTMPERNEGSSSARPHLLDELEAELAKVRLELQAAKEEIAVSDGAALDAIAEERGKFRELAEAALGDAWEGLRHEVVVEMVRRQRAALEGWEAAHDGSPAEGEISIVTSDAVPRDKFVLVDVLSGRSVVADVPSSTPRAAGDDQS